VSKLPFKVDDLDEFRLKAMAKDFCKASPCDCSIECRECVFCYAGKPLAKKLRKWLKEIEEHGNN